MSFNTFQAGLFARLFGGATRDRFTLRDGTLERTLDGKTTLLNLPERFSRIKITSDPIWSHLTFQTAERTVVIRGMPQHEAIVWHRALVDWQRPIREKRAAELTATARQAINGLGSLLDGSQFIRTSYFDRCITDCVRAHELVDTVEFRDIASSEDLTLIAALAQAIARGHAARTEANERFIKQTLEHYDSLFSNVEKAPLTELQRRACIIDDDYNLLLAGAGSGKTSVMIGRAAYLIASKVVQPKEILLVAFNRKAAKELQKRVSGLSNSEFDCSNVAIDTFHALGKNIIAAVEGKQPAVSVLAEDGHKLRVFVSETVEKLLEIPNYAAAYIESGFLHSQPYKSLLSFDSREDYERYTRTLELRALSGDLVKSHEELLIANFLVRQGIDFKYEKPYEHSTATERFRQYSPDFTIFLPVNVSPIDDNPAPIVVYLEHFALNAQGNAPAWFGYGYAEGVAWKRKLHATCGTTLIETQSHEFKSGKALQTLLERLQAAGVSAHPKSDKECLKLLRDRGVVLKEAELFANLIRLARDIEIRSRISTVLTDIPSEDRERVDLLWRLLEPVLSRYESFLQDQKNLDFSEMIHRATRYVREGRYPSPFTRILIDEFQDMSEARKNLIVALCVARPEATLFCVGDDWQSIYRFSGSDVRYVSEFEDRIGKGARTYLDMTFRFNDRLGVAATKFIRKNPEQTQRQLSSLKKSSQPAISLVPSSELVLSVALILDRIRSFEKRRQTRYQVLVLARYNHELGSLRETLGATGASPIPRTRLHFATIHESKGTEADFVILVGLKVGRHGFPAEKPVDPFQEAFLPRRETFPDSEERRVFYVALTRARHRVYLVYDRFSASSFVLELACQLGATVRDEFSGDLIQPDAPLVTCPRCRLGYLIWRRDSTSQTFFGCSRFPGCNHTDRGCEACGNLLLDLGEYKVCSVNGCANAYLKCRLCSSPMKIREGRKGKFFGCSRYATHRCPEIQLFRALPSADTLRKKFDANRPRV